MNFSSHNVDCLEPEFNWFIFGVWILLVCFQSFVIGKLHKRHKGNVEPVHMYQINLLVELMILTCCGILSKLYKKFLIKCSIDNISLCLCVLLKFLHYFIASSMFCSTSILHYDRYQYLCLKSTYKETCQTAWEKIMSFKIISFAVTFIGFFLDSRYASKNKAVIK